MQLQMLCGMMLETLENASLSTLFPGIVRLRGDELLAVYTVG